MPGPEVPWEMLRLTASLADGIPVDLRGSLKASTATTFAF